MGIALAAALFKLLNLRRKRRAEPESLEHALGVPELDNFRLRRGIKLSFKKIYCAVARRYELTKKNLNAPFMSFAGFFESSMSRRVMSFIS